jgi:PPM family protein phosphatase
VTTPVRLALHYAVRSDKGLVRGNNEDSAYAGPRLLAIADGMGGHAGGEVASKIVIGAVEDLDEDRPGNDGDIITSMRESVEDANESLASAVKADKALEGMGTTLTALRFAGSTFGVLHIGDSRAYLMRGGQLTQITHDDTYVQSLVDAGRLTLEEASQHPRKSVILRALNGVAIEPDVSIREARLGDRYLLCTDGLTDVVRAETLLEALSDGDPQDCADRLVALALRGGGPDNVTCIVCDVVTDGQGDDVPVVAGAVVDPGADTGGDADSPAGRAAGLSRGGAVAVRPRRKERRWPRVVAPAAIVALLLAAAAGTWLWTQTQYFVGESGASVVVFRGVNTQVGPVKFYRVVDRTGVKVSDLKPAARDQIDNGITADSRTGADAIVTRLKTDQLLPLCSSLPTATPTPSPSLTTPTPKTPASKTPVTTPRRTTTPRKTTPGRTSAPRTGIRSTGLRRTTGPKTVPKTVAHKTLAHKPPLHTTVVRVGTPKTVSRTSVIHRTVAPATTAPSLTPSAPASSASAGSGCR